ncbi:membrane protein insertion efficiency factor YidD [Streptomyces albipurpureus]|uniref:Membrane protein insertion efficiency factor YidD n=1 Tax=Streptomyces albipurpureus TaxID=2897419 RepID=A0ABT0UMT0_9ACTN|nr:membrane protein insertion efficiency factor YidD [Streptomyces sp. CWNU-1]MCM2389923.1 membrane protein insertion efficiency factor YidD [Streptomyces sp. CWNU-1]
MARSRPNRHIERKKSEDEDGCCVGTIDTCTYYCGPACPFTAVNAIVLARWQPSRSVPVAVAVDPAAPRPDGRIAAVLYGAVRHYRTRVSPARPACCPYTPSCSTYAIKALHRHGAIRGTRLIVARLLRCRPGAARRRGQSDPVPL